MLWLLIVGFALGFYVGFRTHVFGLIMLCVPVLVITIFGGILVGNSASGVLLSALAMHVGLQGGYFAVVVFRAWLAPQEVTEKGEGSDRSEAERIPASRRR